MYHEEKPRAKRRSWSQTANELRERYLRNIARKRGLKFAKKQKVYLVIAGGIFVFKSLVVCVLFMLDQPDKIVSKLLGVAFFLFFFLPGVFLIYTGLGKVIDPLEDEATRSESPLEN